MADRREQYNDAEESLRMAIDGALAQVWTAMPAVITGVDLSAQTVSCQPAIKGAQTSKDGSVSSISMPMLVDVPIVWPRAGGYAVTFPVSAGDECLVVFASRCIDGWWQSGGEQEPAEKRMHDLSDGFAILAPTSQANKLANVQTDGAEFRNESRTQFIKLSDDGKIYITATEVVMVADLSHTGNTTQTGSQTTSGTITGTTDVVGGGKSLKTHTHTTTTTGFPTSAPN